MRHHTATCGIYGLSGTNDEPCDCGALNEAFLDQRRREVAFSRLEQACEAVTCAYGALRVAGLVAPAVALERMTRELDAVLEGLMAKPSKAVGGISR